MHANERPQKLRLAALARSVRELRWAVNGSKDPSGWRLHFYHTVKMLDDHSMIVKRSNWPWETRFGVVVDSQPYAIAYQVNKYKYHNSELFPCRFVEAKPRPGPMCEPLLHSPGFSYESPGSIKVLVVTARFFCHFHAMMLF